MTTNNSATPDGARQGLGGEQRANKLVLSLLSGETRELVPRLDFASDLGFTFPNAEELLGTDTRSVLSLLDSLAAQGILKKTFFDRLLRCSQCGSMNLRPSTHCPKCGSGDVARGIVLEHSLCGYVGIEDEFRSAAGLVCPKCKVELETAGVDFKRLGLLRKCRQCGDVFGTPAIRWRCLRCSSLLAEDKVTEVDVYSYRLDETKRSRLEFEIKPKSNLVEFLKARGYEVIENAVLKGRSGADHRIDLLATRDDGIVTHSLAIGIEVAGDKIGLQKIFSFDDKAYDIGIHDKILIVVPNLQQEAESFADRQRIKVLEVKDLESVLGGGVPQTVPAEKHPFEFKSKVGLVDFLKHQGYEVVENASMRGRSGAEHIIDLVATKDDGIVVHHIAIGIESGSGKIGLHRIFDFDEKAYDIGILDKVFVAVPGLAWEAKQFAQRQRIRVIEAKQL